MKRGELIRALVAAGCYLKRHGKKHDIYANPNTGKQAPVPDRRLVEITPGDLPLHCPLPSMSLWDSHPRVYLPIEATGKAKCPYCGTDFVLLER